MFNTSANRKHTYLHQYLRSDEPAIISQFVDHVIQLGSTEKPIEQLLHPPASLQPASYALVTDLTKAQLAYGRFGVPQLISQIILKERDISYRALGSLIDEMIDPEKCYRALECLDVVRHLSELLEKRCADDDLDQQIISRILVVLQIIVGHLLGAEKFMAEPNNIKNMYHLLSIDIFADTVAKIWSQVASNYMMAELMVQTDHLQYMRAALDQHVDNYELYSALSYLIERSPIRALQAGFFEFLFPLITKRALCQPIIIKCFALAIQCDQGQRMCDAALVIPQLLYILNDDEDGNVELTLDWRPQTQAYEYAAMALHNCLISNPSRWHCQQFWEMPVVLVRHAHCKTNERLQVHCLQALRHITEKPSIKQFVGTVCKSRIKRIYCPSERVRKAKVDLLIWLRFRNYHTKQITTDEGLL